MTKSFNDTVLRSYPTGSRHICNPPVMDTDDDRVVLVNGFHDWEKMLVDEGWTLCEEGEYPDREDASFRAYRKGSFNYIVTEDPEFFQAYVTATNIARRLNLTNKDDRIAVFEEAISSRYDAGYVGTVGLPPEERGQNVFEVREWRGGLFHDAVLVEPLNPAAEVLGGFRLNAEGEVIG